jgi:hypothetical protein
VGSLNNELMSITIVNCSGEYMQDDTTNTFTCSSAASSSQSDTSNNIIISQSLAINNVIQQSLEIINANQNNLNNTKIVLDINSITSINNSLYTIYVDNLNDSGTGSFREAIKLSNNNTLMKSKIIFNVSGSITLLSNLDTIVKSVTIDGITNNKKYKNTPVVEINCNNFQGLVFGEGSDYSSLIGLIITNSVNNGVTIYSSYITLDKNNIILNNGNGISIETTASYNIIGLNKIYSSSINSTLFLVTKNQVYF